MCTYCSKVVLAHLKSGGLNSDSDLQALQDDLSIKFPSYGNSNVHADNTNQQHMHRKISVGYQEERLASNLNSSLSNAERKNILQQSNSLKAIHEEMTKSLPYQNRGIDLVQYLIANQKSSNKVQAVTILNALIKAEFLTALFVTESNATDTLAEFDENCIYKLLRMDDIMTHSGSFQLDLDVETNSVHLSRPNLDESNISEGNYLNVCLI